jgi:drug/metabolite transporter (DMT)-like permease
MTGLRIIAIVLIVAGVLALVYGGFSYTKATHEADFGPIEFSVKETERVNVPLWAGVVVLALGVVLLLVPKKK